jgi:hypothetical protein
VPLVGKWRPSVGKVREWYVASRHLQGCSPRLCHLRTDGLTPVSKYWTYQSHADVYRPSKSSSWLPTVAWLYPHCFIGWLMRETGYGPIDRSADMLWIVLGAFFSGVVTLLNSVDDYMKGCYMWTTWDTYGLGPYMGWAWKSCGVLVGFSPAGCTSIRITVTLRYE